jgi:uncharacterized protein YkwD
MAAGLPMERTVASSMLKQSRVFHHQTGGNIMKRLFCIAFILALILSPNFAYASSTTGASQANGVKSYAKASTAAAKGTVTKAKTKKATVKKAPVKKTPAKKAPENRTIDVKAIVNLTEASLVQLYGKPNRTEPSEYGFTWYVYNSNYSSFFMAGVRKGEVVAVYTNAKLLSYNKQFQLGSSKRAVRAILGSPAAMLRDGNTIAYLDYDQNDAINERHVFMVGNNNVTVFYDNIQGGKVTAVMILPAEDETRVSTTRLEMTNSLVNAYQRLSIDLINAIRVRQGLTQLTVNALNNKLALSRSTDMRDRNYFSHLTPDKVSPAQQAHKMGISYLSLGENIASGHRDAIYAHESFMNSSGHRSIILYRYTKVGSGVVFSSSRGVLITNIFTR